MAPPTPMPCEVEGCNYQTRQGLPSFDMQFQQMRLRIAMAHPGIGAVLDNSASSNTTTTSSRAEKLPRPSIVEDVTETDWNYFKESWTRYKRSTGLEGQSVMDQLWACTSQSLAKACYESGFLFYILYCGIYRSITMKVFLKGGERVPVLSLSPDTGQSVRCRSPVKTC